MLLFVTIYLIHRHAQRRTQTHPLKISLICLLSDDSDEARAKEQAAKEAYEKQLKIEKDKLAREREMIGGELNEELDMKMLKERMELFQVRQS